MVADPNRMNGIMIDFALIVDLAKQTRPATQIMTRINVLNFHGNGNVVCLEGLKHQASSNLIKFFLDLGPRIRKRPASSVALG